MAQTESQNEVSSEKKLLKILSEMFQLDQSDLDFGIYRIMNTKSKEIKEFLENDLILSVSNAFSSNSNSSIQKELDEAIKQAQVLGADPETLPKVKELREQLSSTTTSSNLENDVFSHLANFFKRYYKDGDFVSLRRYKKDTYAIPYEGEEVKLHWANSDQYYIKSGEYFRDYSFKVNDKTIHFKLTDAETESNNNKATSDKERRFVILESNPCEVINDELYINFEYKGIQREIIDKNNKLKKYTPEQKILNEEAIAKALESIEDLGFITALNELAPTEKNPKRTIFEKHLKSYTSKNSFDFFIHKDLGGFLGRELDFYIKNEMLFLDDIMDNSIKYEEVMGKVKIFKEVSQKIISFLTQLEELQKKLWEKKKFIIETNYCITLDKIDEEHYEQILACEEQLVEWKELFDVDVQSIEDLKKEKYLVLDTKFFDTKFKYKLLSEFDNLDEEIDGVLINSENFGALNLLQNRYKEQVKTVYIDPPYNTGSDGFLYNDTYQHSSWISFIYDRLLYSKNLLHSNSSIMASINEDELFNLKLIMDRVFSSENYITTATVKVRHDDRILKGDKAIHEVTEQLLYYKNSFKYEPSKREVDNSSIEEYIWQIEELSDTPSIEYMNGKKVEIFNPNEFKLTKTTPNNTNLKRINIRGSLREGNSSGRFYVANIEASFENKRGYLYKVDDMGADGIGYRYFLIPEEGSNRRNSDYFQGEPLNKNDVKYLPYSNLLDFEKYFNRVGTEDGIIFRNGKKPKKFINHLFKINGTLENKKSIILDFFSGSGSTGATVIEANREDKGKRKYLLVEMGEYFDTVTKPRIQKVIYSDTWKDGKPTTKNGISQIFKYFKLESYEDTLNNLEFKKTKEQEDTLTLYPSAKDDYILNYSLDVESRASLLNIDSFKTPFNYKLKIATSSVGETKETTIDLVETFNYLLGLVVEKTKYKNGFLTVQGATLKNSKILIIWRDSKTADELDIFVNELNLNKFDEVYVNGDNHLDKVKLIEQEFKRLMFHE